MLIALVAGFGSSRASGKDFTEQRGGEALVRMNNCNWTYPTLRNDNQIPELEISIAAAEALPKSIKRPITTGENGVPLRLAVHQWGSGTNPTVLLCIHGMLADSRTWRFVAGALGGEYDLWMVDLPGIGESDFPNPQAIGPDAFGPDALADRILQAVQGCLAERNPQTRIIVVGHSLGGLITLRMLSSPEVRKQNSVAFSHIAGAVMFAPCDVAINQVPPVFKTLATLPLGKAKIGNALGVVREIIAKMEVHGYWHTNLASRESADLTLHSLVTGQHLRAFQTMLRQAVPFDADGQPLWHKIHALEKEYANISVPCLIVWGDSDETLPCAMGYKLEKQVPGARLEVLANCKHSPQKEYPGVCAKLIRNFDSEISGKSSLVVAGRDPLAAK